MDTPTSFAMAQEDRPLGPALRRGWHRRCPNCGEGHLLHSYLKVHDLCPTCGEAMYHQRADDGQHMQPPEHHRRGHIELPARLRRRNH